MIKNAFPIKIWEIEYPNYDKDLFVSRHENYLKKVGTHQLNSIIADSDTTQVPEPFYDKPIPGYTYSTGYTYSITNYEKVLNDMDMPDLWLWINKQIVKYHTHCGYKIFNSSVLSVWTTSAPKGGHVTFHNHNPGITAGVFYIDAEPEQGNLYLLNPNDTALSQIHYNHYNYQNKWYEFEVKSGKLILFPGHLYHMVPKNPTDRRRRIISFDASYY